MYLSNHSSVDVEIFRMGKSSPQFTGKLLHVYLKVLLLLLFLFYFSPPGLGKKGIRDSIKTSPSYSTMATGGAAGGGDHVALHMDPDEGTACC